MARWRRMLVLEDIFMLVNVRRLYWLIRRMWKWRRGRVKDRKGKGKRGIIRVRKWWERMESRNRI